MANLKDIFTTAANHANIPMLYGTPDQVENAHRLRRTSDNAKPYPVLLVFQPNTAEVNREYFVYNNFIVVFCARVKDEKIQSKNSEVFETLRRFKDELISGLCKTYGITGIYPSMFMHTEQEKLLLLATDKVCGLEVTFENIQIKNC